jgi:DNA helicase-2/ATP-dependent DNA helicase PcrA
VIDWLLSDAERGEIQRALADYGQPASSEVLVEISRAKNALLTPEGYERSCSIQVRRSSPPSGARPSASCGAATRWTSMTCSRARCGCSPSTRTGLAWLRQRWRWILADEFQDTSHAQATLVDLLAGPDGNLCVCGDDDQLIHGWRHADPRHVLCFAERHPGHAQIVRGRNFRSRAEILEAAVRCVAHNERRAPKALIAMRGLGGGVRVRAFPNEFAEANWVTAQIADALAAGTPSGEVLALARTGYATEPLQRALAHAGIPHRVLGSLGLYERTEVRDALAYLTLLANPLDAQALRRAVGSPRRGIGNATVTKLVSWARAHHGGDLIAASAHAASWKPFAPGRRAIAWRSSAPGSSTSARSSMPGGRSGTWRSRQSWRRAGSCAITSTSATTLRTPNGVATPSGCSRTCARCAAQHSATRSRPSTRP